jgi:hypothetical protein
VNLFATRPAAVYKTNVPKASGMNTDDLTTDQAKQLQARIGPMLGYLYRLRSRMDKRGFPRDDELRQLVERAYESVHRLSVELHYLSCKSGVGRPPRKQLASPFAGPDTKRRSPPLTRKGRPMPSSRSWFALGLVAVVGVVSFGLGWAGLSGDSALAQQSGPEGIYAVTASGETSVLINTRTGNSWQLVKSADKASSSVWLPIERLDSPNSVAKWRAEEQERAQEVAKQRSRDREKSNVREMLRGFERQLEHRRDAAKDSGADAEVNMLEKKIAELKARLADLGE